MILSFVPAYLQNAIVDFCRCKYCKVLLDRSLRESSKAVARKEAAPGCSGLLDRAAVVASTPVLRAQATPKMQEPADRKAFSAAHHVSDKAKQRTAMQTFIRAYPKSQSVPSAQRVILGDMLQTTPGDTEGIAKQAKLVLKPSKTGPDRWQAEAELARQLADAGTDGVDLPLAKKWARDAEHHLDPEKYGHADLADYKRYKMGQRIKLYAGVEAPYHALLSVF